MKFTVRLLVMLVVAGVVFGGIFAFDAFRSVMIAKFMKGFANPTQTVATMPAVMEPWQSRISATGTLRAVNGADLSADLDGIVDQINFKSGDDVAAGTVLLRMRSEDDPAKLKQLQTQAALAQTNYDRDLRQLKAQAVARSTVDTDLSALHSAQAAVAQQEATIAKKTVVAPFAGHLGIREVDLGQYVAAGTAIVTLQALDPIYVDFYVPQQQMSLLHIGQAVSLSVDAYPGQEFAGTIEAANARVDPLSRALMVRASVANPDHKLLPGMFATVTIAVGAPTSFVTLPQTAITYNPYGATVFIVNTGADGKTLTAHQEFVTPGDTRGDQVAITKGVAAGDTVVVAGQMKLHNGTPIAVNNSLLPSNDPNPSPTEQ